MKEIQTLEAQSREEIRCGEFAYAFPVPATFFDKPKYRSITVNSAFVSSHPSAAGDVRRGESWAFPQNYLERMQHVSLIVIEK